MLKDLQSAVTDLPVIIQGAMGSALFALLLFLGQKATALVSRKYTTLSRRQQEQVLLDEIALLSAVHAEDDQARTHFGVIVIFRMARHLVRALFWFTLGQIFGTVVPVFELVGNLGCLIYLLFALRMLQVVRNGTDTRAKLDAAQKRLNELIDP